MHEEMVEKTVCVIRPRERDKKVWFSETCRKAKEARARWGEKYEKKI